MGVPAALTGYRNEVGAVTKGASLPKTSSERDQVPVWC